MKKFKPVFIVLGVVILIAIALIVLLLTFGDKYIDTEVEVTLNDDVVLSDRQVSPTTFNNDIVVNQVEIIKQFNQAAYFTDEKTREEMESAQGELLTVIEDSIDLLPKQDEVNGEDVEDFHSATMQWYNFYKETVEVSLAEITEIWYKDPLYQEDYDRVIELIDAMNARIDEEDLKFEEAQKDFAETNDFELDVEIGD